MVDVGKLEEKPMGLCWIIPNNCKGGQYIWKIRALLYVFSYSGAGVDNF